MSSIIAGTPTGSQAELPARALNQTLLFDADDTLWENNIYFERAIAAFISYLDHRVHSPEEVREHLNTCERATIAAHGYGLQSFRRSLVTCFEQLTDSVITPEKHARIVSFTESISAAEIELLDGVSETLKELSRRHRLMLVTKGNLEEQTDKLERSGLRPFFSAVEILAEKNETAYRELAARHSLDKANTWMIGNSPKSDINPSLAAGFHAVFVPHGFTWVLEHETVDAPTGNAKLLELARIAELTRYF
ncbi:HAD family hydrolase [Granulicella mallensis]|uniref:HAD-superfamily hydrolase, subfamily IA, variant 1 n=1 Tax=Granulicella mallensis (strain ATCC BAA-1857 / DSM 23137 / MP5ACTX8) TaxID=682795 RepID=G8NY40_GRAMM|nr:HAD family hydrolase [Granulicella mallensis]AEU36714.1 HAD-superfamily hydrolase, subfamily IA, variant 1 [Granulicella mallensis MP5ACTX8]